MSVGRIQGHTDAIYSVALHPSNADIIASASGDDTGGLWSRSTKRRIAVLDGHTDTVVQVAFNAAGTLVATAGMDGVVKVWNSTDGKPVATLEGPGEDITFINLNQSLKDNEEWLFVDRLHLTDAGYRYVAKDIFNTIGKSVQ